jgi:protein-disulfide isomerase
MAKKQETGAPSKRQVIREQRAKRQKQQRLIAILVVAAGALVVVGLVIFASLRENLTPVGEIKTAVPVERPQADGKSLGDPNAPVVIEVWEDFQCPACRDFSAQIEPEVVKNLVATGKARYVFRQYPFIDANSATKESHQAANASMCALEQGRFWDYHDIVFANWNGENTGALTDKRLTAFAQTIGLDMTQFNTCFKANKYKDQIEQDFTDGTKAGVQGTPSVFVNGQIVRPGYIPSYDDIVQAVSAASG